MLPELQPALAVPRRYVSKRGGFALRFSSAFLGDMVAAGAGLVAFLCSMMLSLLTIAVGWIAYRPLLGLALSALAVGVAVVATMRLGRRQPQPA